jgi:hypothetical protein
VFLTQIVNTKKGRGIDLPPNPHNQRVLRQQQQAEMDPPNPPPAGTYPVVAALMQIVTPGFEGKPNANHVRARISNSRTRRLHK